MRRAVWSTGRRNSNRERSRIHKDSWQPSRYFQKLFISKNEQMLLSSCETHVDSSLVLDEALRVRTDRREQYNVSFSALQP